MNEYTDTNTKQGLTADAIHDPETSMKDCRQFKKQCSAEKNTAGNGQKNETRPDRRAGYSLIFFTTAAGIIVFTLLFHAGYFVNSCIVLTLFAVSAYKISDHVFSVQDNICQRKDLYVNRNEVTNSYSNNADYHKDCSESAGDKNKENISIISIMEKDKAMEEKKKAAEKKSMDAGWTGYYIPPEVFMSDDPYKIRKGILKSTGHIIPVKYLKNDKNIGKRVGEYLDLMDDEEEL